MTHRSLTTNAHAAPITDGTETTTPPDALLAASVRQRMQHWLDDGAPDEGRGEAARSTAEQIVLAPAIRRAHMPCARLRSRSVGHARGGLRRLRASIDSAFVDNVFIHNVRRHLLRA